MNWRTKILLCLIIIPLSVLWAGLDLDLIEPIQDDCVKVESPVLIKCDVMGEVRLLGLKPPDKDSKYYKQGVDFVKERILGKTVLIDICHINPTTEEGYLRAVVFYMKEDRWFNLNEELVRNGLAQVVPVILSHPDPKIWLTDQKEAQREHLGIWEDFGQTSKFP